MLIMQTELTKQQIRRQDDVDNAINRCIETILEDMTPADGRYIYKYKWDINVIANIRDTIFNQLANQNYINRDEQEQEFYPFIEEKSEPDQPAAPSHTTKCTCPECGTAKLTLYDNQPLGKNDFDLGLDNELYGKVTCINGHRFDLVGEINWDKGAKPAEIEPMFKNRALQYDYDINNQFQASSDGEQLLRYWELSDETNDPEGDACKMNELNFTDGDTIWDTKQYFYDSISSFEYDRELLRDICPADRIL